MKKKLLSLVLALVLCLGLALPALAADTLEIHWVDDSIRVFDGNAIVFTGGLLMVQKKDTEEYGYIDATGQWVDSSVFDGLMWAAPEGMRRITKGEKWGFADVTGKVIVPPKYDQAEDFSEGLAAVAVNVGRQGCKWGFIDKTGAEVIPPKYNAVSSFSEGLAAVSMLDDDWQDHWGYIDRTGKEVIPLTLNYTSVAGFSNGLAAFYTEEGEGLIDRTGKEIVAPQKKYSLLQPLPCGLIGTTVFSETTGVLHGYLDASGQEIVPPKYDEVHEFSDGLARVRVNIGQDRWGTAWKYGFIDTTGREVVPPQYDSAFDFSDGMARVGMRRRETDNYNDHGYIDTTGRLVVPTEHEYAGDFSEGLAAVSIRDRDDNVKYVYLNTAGQIAISKEYDGARSFSDGLAAVSQGHWSESRSGYIDKTGKQVIPFQYDEVYPFADGLAKVRVGDMVNGKYGLIDKDGEVVLPIEYDLIGEFSEGLTWVKSGERFGIIRDPYWTDPSSEDPGQSETPGAPSVPELPTAYASTQSVLVDGVPVEFQAYALRDADGGVTNYIKLRDVAYVLNGTAAQFEVGWDGDVDIRTGQAYTVTGTEMSTPFSGDRTYGLSAADTKVNGQVTFFNAIVLTDDDGGDYTYYKLRDLGQALGFDVAWSAEEGISIRTE